MKLQKLLSLTRQAIDAYGMIEENDKIAEGQTDPKTAQDAIEKPQEQTAEDTKADTAENAGIWVIVNGERVILTGKAEYIFSLLISLSMIIIAFKLLYDSTTNLILGTKFTFSWMLVLVCFITIITKLSLFLYTLKLYKINNNLLLKANMKDHRNDCIITTFLSIINIYWFDSVVGIGISIWICITGIKIFIESYNVLMDKAIDNTTKEEIFEIISTYKDIKGAKHFTSTPVGYQYLISISIDLDGNMSTFESHKIADSLEKKINKLPSVYLSIIHVNPV